MVSLLSVKLVYYGEDQCMVNIIRNHSAVGFPGGSVGEEPAYNAGDHLQ